MSKGAGLTCPRCGSADLELERADVDGETADETTVQRCRQCGARFSTTTKRDRRRFLAWSLPSQWPRHAFAESIYKRLCRLTRGLGRRCATDIRSR